MSWATALSRIVRQASRASSRGAVTWAGNLQRGDGKRRGPSGRARSKTSSTAKSPAAATLADPGGLGSALRRAGSRSGGQATWGARSELASGARAPAARPRPVGCTRGGATGRSTTRRRTTLGRVGGGVCTICVIPRRACGWLVGWTRERSRRGAGTSRSRPRTCTSTSWVRGADRTGLDRLNQGPGSAGVRKMAARVPETRETPTDSGLFVQVSRGFRAGAAYRNRTDDLFITSEQVGVG